MTLLADIENTAYNRLEESQLIPQFWTPAEVRPAIIEGLFEAALISGEPQQRQSKPLPIIVNQTLQAMPDGAIAIIRVECSGPLYKTSVWDLDQTIPSWESQTTDGAPTHWFPVGLTQWGVYPKITAPVNAIFTVVQVPVTPAWNYDGGEAIPFQEEFISAFADYCGHALRLKDSMQSFIDGFAEYGKFLQACEDLSKFGFRKGSLRFSRSLGSVSQVTNRELEG